MTNGRDGPVIKSDGVYYQENDGGLSSIPQPSELSKKMQRSGDLARAFYKSLSVDPKVIKELGAMFDEHPGPPPSCHGYSWDIWYVLYLKSDAWKRIRERILTRANYQCEECAVNPASQIHHLTYARVGFEDDCDLAALCRTCHASLHGR